MFSEETLMRASGYSYARRATRRGAQDLVYRMFAVAAIEQYCDACPDKAEILEVVEILAKPLVPDPSRVCCGRRSLGADSAEPTTQSRPMRKEGTPETAKADLRRRASKRGACRIAVHGAVGRYSPSNRTSEAGKSRTWSGEHG